jgi:8-oxo-dGTP diphosphatase
VPYKRNRVAALVVKGDTILLVLHKKGNKEYYLLPGGGVEQGEFEEEALKRELLEEAGLSITAGKMVFETESFSPDKTRHIIQKVYLCKANGEIGPSKDPRVVRAVYMTREEFRQVKFYPNIREEILAAWDQGFPGPAVSLTVPWED